MQQRKRIILSVSNDLTTDQRLHKVCTSLQAANYELLLVGRKLPDSINIDRKYKTKRFRLWFNNGPLFYANYNFRLFWLLLFSKVDIIVANDLDTLFASFLASKIKSKTLVYDSHELFTEVPELIHRPRVQKVWEQIEGYILPRLKHSYTVGGEIAKFYQSKYGIQMEVIRNFPLQYNIDTFKKDDVIIYQGALNVGRGLEELILAMQYVEGAQLLIAGAGDLDKELREKVTTLKLQKKVQFLGRLPMDELIKVTTLAKIGVSIEKKEGLNYVYALPNKIFDYLQASVPILYSDLIEVKNTLRNYEVGEELVSYKEKEMATQIQQMLQSPNYDNWVENCRQAAQEFNWEVEEQKLLSLYQNL